MPLTIQAAQQWGLRIVLKCEVNVRLQTEFKEGISILLTIGKFNETAGVSDTVS